MVTAMCIETLEQVHAKMLTPGSRTYTLTHQRYVEYNFSPVNCSTVNEVAVQSFGIVYVVTAASVLLNFFGSCWTSLFLLLQCVKVLCQLHTLWRVERKIARLERVGCNFYSHQLMRFFIQLCISLLSYIKIT